jgi:RsiW-degrading membrane proteinase PrsW (M82 family)
MCWLVLYYKKDKKEPEPKKIIIKTFIVGAAISTPFLFLYYAMSRIGINIFFFGGIISIILFPVLEEMAKISAAIFVVNDHKHEFNQIIDGVVYAVTASLGFAFMENLFYLASFHGVNTNMGDFIYVIAFRSLGTMFAHTLFSGLAGLIWAYAYFSKQISPFNKKNLLVFEIRDWFNREILSLHIIRHNILKAQPSRRGGHEKQVLVMEGLMLAIFLHIIFNLTTDFEIFGQNLTFLLVPLLIAGFFYISYIFTKRLNIKMLKVV